MIKSPRTINSSADNRARSWSRTMYHMQHAITFIYAFNNPSSIQRAGVAWLPAACGIERCPVESNSGPIAYALTDIDNTSVKFNQMGIAVIQTLSWPHGNR